jgi:hypothetical protein
MTWPPRLSATAIAGTAVSRTAASTAAAAAVLRAPVTLPIKARLKPVRKQDMRIRVLSLRAA